MNYISSMKTDPEDRQWVLLEEGYPHTVLLTKDEAEVQKQRQQMKFRHLEYKVVYDAYYEYREITN